MKIHSIRRGFATNSSSLHSIVFIPGGAHDDYDGQEFGWRFFTIGSETGKREYLGQQLKQAFERQHGLSSRDAALIASSWSGAQVDSDGCVDHQSQITFPVESSGYGRTTISKPFFDDVLRAVLRPDAVVLGGNDNDCEDHPLEHKSSGELSLPTDESVSICRYDSSGSFWALFDQKTGTKLRISFVDGADTSKSEVPELLDVKITDYCNKGCRYCYQGSTEKGKHAEFRDIEGVAYSLSKIGVFEVALGGGEPTSHPKFVDIVRSFRKHEIVPNFSTRDVGWLLENWREVEPFVGAVGLSVDSIQLGRKGMLGDVLEKLDKVGCEPTVQVVVGACSDQDLLQILETCDEHRVGVLLLGWKTVGRGTKGPQHEIDLRSILDRFFKDNRWCGPRMSFDTVLAEQMSDWLESHEVSKRFYDVTEGAHSMYVDCVTKTIAPSSFETKNAVAIGENMYRLDNSIRKNFPWRNNV